MVTGFILSQALSESGSDGRHEDTQNLAAKPGAYILDDIGTGGIVLKNADGSDMVIHDDQGQRIVPHFPYALIEGLTSRMQKARANYYAAQRASGCCIASLAKPRTLKRTSAD